MPIDLTPGFKLYDVMRAVKRVVSRVVHPGKGAMSQEEMDAIRTRDEEAAKKKQHETHIAPHSDNTVSGAYNALKKHKEELKKY